MKSKFVLGLLIGTMGSLSSYYLLNNSINSLIASPFHSHAIQEHDHSMYAHPKLIISSQAQWLSIEELEASLKDVPPMNVGFDVDDTLIFTNTSFYVATKKHCPEDISPGHKKCIAKQAFWDELNAMSELSPPKEIGKRLIQMHKKRGDNIFFITAREKSKHMPENLTQTLNTSFNLSNEHGVIYLGIASINVDKPGKTQSIIDNNIQIYYGDSDADIAAAKAANIRGIRVMRAANSQDNLTMPINGRFGEEVLIDSDI